MTDQAARYGIVLPAIPGVGSAASYIRAACLAEELGFGSVFCGDHLFGTVGTFECLTMLAGIAAATEAVKVGSAVIVLPLREPAVTAKQVATIDQIAEGRFILGVGSGGERPEEFTAVGKSVTQRGRLTDSYLELMTALWTGEPVGLPDWPGVDGQLGSPLPYGGKRPAIWVGGRSDAALERALRYDGWTGYAVSARGLAKTVATLREQRADMYLSVLVFTRVDADGEAASRTAKDIIFTYYGQDWSELLPHVAAVGDRDHVGRRLAEYRAAGVDEVIACPLAATAEDLAGQLATLAAITRPA